MQKIAVLALVVIAIATSASAVETVYGWSKVTPAAQEALKAGYSWTGSMLGLAPMPATPAAPAKAAPAKAASAAPASAADKI